MFLRFRNILTLAVIIVCVICKSQDIVLGSRSISMGRTSAALVDEWSNNPAGISSIKSLKIAVFYESRFLLKELSSKAISVAYPNKIGSFGLVYKHTGFNLFNNQFLGISYSKCFNKKISIGVRLNYISNTAGNNIGKYSTITFDIGFQIKVSESILIAGWTYNPVAVKIGNENLISTYRFGTRYIVSKGLIICAEIEKNTEVRPIIFRLGMEYIITTGICVRSGISTCREIFSFGLGIKLGKMNLNIGSVMHINLGVSPNTDISYTN